MLVLCIFFEIPGGLLTKTGVFYFFLSGVDFKFNITIKRNTITQERNVFMCCPFNHKVTSLLNFSIYNFCLLIQVHLITFRRFFILDLICI